MRKVLILGATSAIAQEAAKCFAADGDALFLVARNPDKLDSVADDLRVRGAHQVDSISLDLNEFSRHEEVIKAAQQALTGLDTVLIAHGTLGDQQACEKDFTAAETEYRTNFLSAVSLLTPLANFFEAQRHGTIAVITSVAGERGRKSNYIYGSAKGALALFLQGLRNRLYASGVSVVTIIPGFVDTPMTTEMKKNVLFASPEQVGAKTYQAIVKAKDVVFIPSYWRLIMFIIRMIPERFFKRLNL